MQRPTPRPARHPLPLSLPLSLPWSLLAALAAATLSAPAGALDFHGYFRALAASNSSKGGATCFKLDGAMSKYRLGNECETYGEFMFNQQVVTTDDGAAFKANIMLSLYNPNSTAGATQVGLPQVYLQGEKLPELNGGNVWMGRKYYRRESLGPNDFFYWSGQGFGAGVEDIPAGGPLKFSYAWLRRDNLVPVTTAQMPVVGALAENGGNSASRHDVQLRGIPANPGATLELGVSLVAKDARSPTDDAGLRLHSGYGVTLQHRQLGLYGDGWNKLALQFGRGPGTGGSDSAIGSIGDLTHGSNVTRWRLVEGAYAQLTPKLGVELVAIWQKDRGLPAAQVRPGVHENKVWTSLGAHVVYGVTRHLKLAANLGLDTVKPDRGATRHMTTFTLAPTLTAGPGLYTRPDLRLFYTYAKWNAAARSTAALASPGSALSPGGAFGSATSGSMLGVQAEAWY